MNTPEQPNDTPLNELTPSLRAAVVAAKTRPVPKKSQERALKRAASRPPKMAPWLRVRRELIGIAAIAAVLFLGVGLMPSPTGAPKREDDEKTRTVAQLEPHALLFAPIAAGRVRPHSEEDPFKFDLEQPTFNRVTRLESEESLKARLQGRSGARRGDRLMDESELSTTFNVPRNERAAVGGDLPVQGHTIRTGTPASDLGLPSGQNGSLATTKLAKLTEDWTNLPEKDRAKAMLELSRNPDPKFQEALHSYYRTLGTGKDVTLDTGKDKLEPKDGKPGEAKPTDGERKSDPVTATADKKPDVATGEPCLKIYSAPAGNANEIAKTLQETYKNVPSIKITAAGNNSIIVLAKNPTDQLRIGSLLRTASDKSKPSEPTAEKKTKPRPQVWRRKGAQPTMARVYVGDGNALDMVSLHVSVMIDGPRARTTVDQVFHNPAGKQLEGTFEYPLPTGASPSYFAMFLGDTRATMPPRFHGRTSPTRLPASALAALSPTELVADVDRADWGRLQEARIVSRDKATETYEDVVRGRVDPALLEYASGNTFRGRVFPIAPKGYNRVILAYEELLPLADGQLLYRFPLPDLPVNEVQFTLTANTKQCKTTAFLPKDAKEESGGSQVSYSKTWKDEAPKEGVVLFAGTPVNPRIQAVCGQQGENGLHHLFARLRPDLKKIEKAKPFASDAVFLLDTSLSENPDRFNVNMKLLKKILENDSDIKRFNILTFNVAGAWVAPKGWLTNDAAGREKALAKLDGIVLEGATDVDAALTCLRAGGLRAGGRSPDRPPFIEKGTPLNVFLLSDGHVTWGESEVNTIVSRYEANSPYPTRFYCYRVGMGAENAELFDALARQGGGVFNCLTEPEMTAAATAHRNLCFTVEGIRFVGGPEASDVLLAGRKVAVHPGGELVIAAKLNGPAKGKLIVEGKFQGESMTQTFPLDIGSHSELAARAWAEVAVGSLLALNDSRLDSLVTAYCQQYGVASRSASFLVLENEADYKRLNLEAERGKTVNGDLGAYIQKLWRQMGEMKSARQAFAEFLDRIEPRVKLMQGPQGDHVKKLLTLLNEKDYELPPSALRGGLVRKTDVPPGYLAERDQDRRNVAVYLKEAKRRADADDIDGAVRVLSSVIEEHAGRDDALRLVGYRLLDLKQADQAAHLFRQVQRQRPFEPHSYRDLARSLEDAGLYGLAAVQYEIVLAGTWHARFHHDSLKLVVQEEYARMMQDAIRRKAVSKELADHFGERLEKMTSPQPQSDLRVTISWNTDATDVDLWVIEPDGTKCYYQHNRTKNGGELSQDQTQGYGPERYQVAKALPGEYKIMVHYFSANPNLLGGETHVNVLVTRFAGTPQETTQRHTVILKKAGEAVEVSKVKY